MHDGAECIVDIGIGGELTAAQTAPPILNGFQQSPANSTAPHPGLNEPSLEIGNAIRLTPFRKRPDGQLRKSYDRTSIVFCEEDRLGPIWIFCEVAFHLQLMLRD